MVRSAGLGRSAVWGCGVVVRKVLIFGAMLAFSAQVEAETLTNGTVSALANSGLGDAVIVAKIKSSEPQFDLSSAALVDLKTHGVSDTVIAAMIERGQATAQAAEYPMRSRFL